MYQSDSDYPTKNPTLDLRSVYQSDSLLIGAASFLRNPTHAEAAHPYFQLLLFSTFSMQAAPLLSFLFLISSSPTFPRMLAVTLPL